MNHRWAPVVLLLLLCGCSDVYAQSRYAAASDASAFIRAAKSDDRAAFEAHMDGPAVLSDIRAQLAKARGAKGAVMLAASRAGSRAGRNPMDPLVRPSNFHFKAAPGSFGGMLGAAHLALMLRSAGKGRLCLPESFWSKSCVLTLAKEGGRWKVVGMSLALLAAGEAPVSAI